MQATKSSTHFLSSPAVYVMLAYILIECAHGESKAIRPVLVDTSACADVADLLSGKRTLGSKNENVVQLHQAYTLPSLSTRKCVVSLLFLDQPPNDSKTTTYGDLLNRGAAEGGMVQKIWKQHVASLSDNQQLIIVTCDLDETTVLQTQEKMDMPSTTNFDFILQQTDGPNSWHVLECVAGEAFCMLRLDTQGCINSKYITNYLPSSEENVHNMFNLQMSMMGSASAMMKLVSVTPRDITGKPHQSRIIMGMNTTASHGAFNCTCTNEENTPCTVEQADRYAAKLVVGLKFVTRAPDDFFFVTGVVKSAGTENHYDLNFVWYVLGFDDFSPQMNFFLQGNKICPTGAQMSGPTDTFRDLTGIYKLACVACGINTYYTTVETPAPVIPKGHTMFISSETRSGKDPGTGMRHRSRVYFIASNSSLSGTFREKYRQESVVEVGTLLTLKIGDPNKDNSPGTDSKILRLECEGQDVQYTSDVSASSISFEVTAKYSGKLILVHLEDPRCCDDYANSNEIYAPEWQLSPALIFVRGPEISQRCVACPVGKFSGVYAATDISKCIESKASQSQRFLPSASRRSIISSDSKQIRTYVEVNGIVIDILEIRQFLPQAQGMSSPDFAIEAWLDTSNITFVRENTALLENSIFKIYDTRPDGMTITLSNANLLQAGKAYVILFMQGTYGTASAIPPISKTAASLPPDVQLNILLYSTIALCGVVLILAIVALALCIHKLIQSHRTAKHTVEVEAEDGYSSVHNSDSDSD